MDKVWEDINEIIREILIGIQILPICSDDGIIGHLGDNLLLGRYISKFWRLQGHDL